MLDTNVLMHDPTSIFRFQEHDVYLPMVVLEELDANKKGLSEASRNVRQVSRFLDDLMRDATKEQIDAGLPLPSPHGIGSEHGNGPAAAKSMAPPGRLFFQTRQLSSALPDYLPGHGATTPSWRRPWRCRRCTTKRASRWCPRTSTCASRPPWSAYTPRTTTATRPSRTPMSCTPASRRCPRTSGRRPARTCKSWKEAGRTYYQVTGPIVSELHVNQFVHEAGESGIEAIVRRIEAGTATLELARDFRSERHSVWGVTARNREQNFALNLLMDPEIDFVTILGPAGTGKTLLTLAAGLMQTLESNRFAEIIMTRVTIPLGEDIGFLPGTEEEKMEPWMGALMDNLEVLTQSTEGGNWGRGATNDLLRNRIKIRSLNFMRGRTFLNRFVILDEAQNLTPKQMKALVTRAGPGTKVVCLGNIAQIDTPYLTETTSGLTYVVNRFRGWGHAGHITLVRGERSRLADFASDTL